MATRWMRGLVPRTVREVIFAIGINQLSDRLQSVALSQSLPAAMHDPAARNVMGSMAAGVLTGYLSHVPHNLSALKLLKPQVSYAEHMNGLVMERLRRFGFVPADAAAGTTRVSGLRYFMGIGMVMIMPKGVLVRTGQIVGSFVIINGAIAFFSQRRVTAPTPLAVKS